MASLTLVGLATSPQVVKNSGPLTTRLLFRLHILRWVYTAFNIAGLIVSCVAAEYVLQARTQFASDPLGRVTASQDPLGATPTTFWLKLLATLLTAATLLLLVLTHYWRYKLGKCRGVLLPEQKFLHSLHLTEFLVEFACVAIHCPVGCYANVQVANTAGLRALYDADSLITMLQFVRLKPLVLLALLYVSGFESMHTVVVSARSGVKLTEEVALRAVFKKHGINSTVAFYLLALAVLTYCMHTSERVVCLSSDYVAADECPGPQQDMSNWSNSLWGVVITSLTVGYGDAVPRTYIGRTVAVVAGVAGISLIALLSNAVTQYVRLSDPETRATETLDRWAVLRAKKSLARTLAKTFLVYAVGKLRRIKQQGEAKRQPRLAARYVAPLTAALVQWKANKKEWDDLVDFASLHSQDVLLNETQKLQVSERPGST